MGTDDGAINEMEGPIQNAIRVCLRLQIGEDALPDASFAPTVEPARHRAACAIARGQVHPRRATTQDPEDAVDDGTMIEIGTARAGLFGWKQRLQPRPLFVKSPWYIRARPARSMPVFADAP